ncbi:putative ATP-dependent endonuclease of OLD family [Paenibacillus silagei]|uniref:ATP-dependent endonuclease of OLD family n=2 Tax=Paenibacillus silagei TaxID=1670801 RepID=A0ABS4P1R4_9BACL|nr:ATP-dependent endonuclease [Paenibacillus silagei]MBP2116243.1 putative ATP-dependent endonuclease of OLD family [Paenibacillus silagei]
MHISKIHMKNFRLLKDTTIDMKNDLSLLIGRNNSGKTSFLCLFEKFYTQTRFNYNDFSLSLRDKIKKIESNTAINELSIQMILEIKYDEEDDLENISEFILDLEPDMNTVKIVFECSINKIRLLKDLSTIGEKDREKYITKNIDNYLEEEVYVFEDYSDLESINRHKLIKKDLKAIKKLINFQIIHAKRDVSSSEENRQSKKALSILTTKFFNNNNKNPNADFTKINELMIEMDGKLDLNYSEFFAAFLKNSKEFLNLQNLQVVSNLQSKELLENSSQVVYGIENNHLPEHLNGLGYMNILYLLLTIEMKKEIFINDKKDINLLFIEEPEAHTHPQMQYIFARKIKNILLEINNLQTVITTHSSHIVSQCDFKDIRYLLKTEDEENIEIKNFYIELSKRYKDKEDFKFLEQYLTIQSAELFFASKIIFIEGTTEKILLPYFINKFDEQNIKMDKSYIPLNSQNISVLEVGANAKSFHEFIDFLNIKTLIITDIDTTKKSYNKNKIVYPACEVSKAQNTSNYTLKHFLKAPEGPDTVEFKAWLEKLVNKTLPNHSENINIAYQELDGTYHGRSFEDAFIHCNLETIKKKRTELQGLKRKEELDEILNIYELTEAILDKKSDFASSILYLALTDEEVDWTIPSYIKGGLSWIAK